MLMKHGNLWRLHVSITSHMLYKFVMFKHVHVIKQMDNSDEVHSKYLIVLAKFCVQNHNFAASNDIKLLDVSRTTNFVNV